MCVLRASTEPLHRSVQPQKTSNGMSCWTSVPLYLPVRQQAQSAGPPPGQQLRDIRGVAVGALCALVEATGGGRREEGCGTEGKVRLHPTVAPGSVLQRCPKWRPTAGLLIHSEGANFGGQVPSARAMLGEGISRGSQQLGQRRVGGASDTSHHLLGQSLRFSLDHDPPSPHPALLALG